MKLLNEKRVHHDTLVPLTDCELIEATFKKHRDRYNVARIGSELYDLEDIQACKRILEQIKQERTWFSLSEIHLPVDFPKVDTIILQSFQNLVNENCYQSCVTRAYPLLLKSDLTLLIGQNWINLQLIEIFSDFVNNKSSNSINISLPTLLLLSRETYLKRLKDMKKIKRIVLLLLLMLDKTET